MHVAVVGTGLMGTGIGLGFAHYGASVTYLVRDRDRAQRVVRKLADEMAAIGIADRDLAEDVSLCTTVDGLPPSDLIIESVPENRALKVALLAELSSAQPRALLCSNTSSLSITDIASGTMRPERVAGMHFWYPPPLMPLVELVPGERTSAGALDLGMELLRSHGKTPIRLTRDIPGFVWNRLVVAVLREAKSLVEQGVVSAREVDLVVEQGLARRWSLTGPFASAVLGGVATFETVGGNLLPRLSTDTDLGGLSLLLDGYVSHPDSLDAWRNRQLAARTDLAAWTSRTDMADRAVPEP